MILCDNKNHYSFIHSFILAISIAQVHYTTRKRSRLQHGYCIGFSRRSAQATVSKALAQGPYVVARAGVEPMTLRLRVIDLTNAPPRPISVAHLVYSCLGLALESANSGGVSNVSIISFKMAMCHRQ